MRLSVKKFRIVSLPELLRVSILLIEKKQADAKHQLVFFYLLNDIMLILSVGMFSIDIRLDIML